MIDQENKCIKLLQDYQELVKSKGEFDVMFADIKKEKLTVGNSDYIRKKIDLANKKKWEVKNLLKNFLEYKLIKEEKKKLEEFFGEEITVLSLPKEITIERIERWKKQGFELHYLPKVDLLKSKKLRGWKDNATELYTYVSIFADQNKLSTKLSSGWILIDNREIPQYENGRQMYENDVLRDKIKMLRDVKIIKEYRIEDSRFCISSEELEKIEVKTAFAEVVGVGHDQIFLPKAIESIFLKYLNKWKVGYNKGYSYEWYGDKKNIDVLHSGVIDSCGLNAKMYYESDGLRSDAIGFRLMVRFCE